MVLFRFLLPPLALGFWLVCLPVTGWAGMYVAAAGGVVGYSSGALDALNRRARDSVALRQPSAFGTTWSTSFDSGYFAPKGNLNFQLSYQRFSQELQGEPVVHVDDTLSSSFAGQSMVLSVGKRVFGAGSDARVPQSVLPTQYSYCVFGVLAGMFVSQHRFSVALPRENTSIAYEFSTAQWTYGPHARAGYVFGRNYEAFIDVAYGIGRMRSRQSKLESFTLRGEDLRYRAHELGINSLASSPVNWRRAALGFAFWL